MAWTMDKARTLSLPVDALALLILRDYVDGGGWNWQNWMRESEQEGNASDRDISGALSEGWSWLMTHGLVVPDASQHSPNAYRVSRLGLQTLEHGLAGLAAAERLGVTTLHPRIGQRVEQQFLLGEFEQAVFIATKEVEVRVREMAGLSNSVVGTDLMAQAFSPKIPGPLADSTANGGEQVAMMELFKGAIGLFKNPSSHRPVNYEDPVLASEIVLFADLLQRLLDQVEKRNHSDQ